MLQDAYLIIDLRDGDRHILFFFIHPIIFMTHQLYIKYKYLRGDGAASPSRKCGNVHKPMVFLSSGNVMLLTMVTSKENNFPGFRATYSQIPLSNTSKNTGRPGTTSRYIRLASLLAS